MYKEDKLEDLVPHFVMTYSGYNIKNVPDTIEPPIVRNADKFKYVCAVLRNILVQPTKRNSSIRTLNSWNVHLRGVC